MRKYISRRAELEDACSRVASLKAAQLSLFRAVADYRIAVVGICGSDVRWPAAALARSDLSTVVLIDSDTVGPDPDPPPERWMCRNRPPGWARAEIAHGAGGEAGHSRLAVAEAERFRRPASIECRSEHPRGWASQPWRRPPVVITPRDRTYPVPTRPEGMH
jgi:hypothetical protein